MAVRGILGAGLVVGAFAAANDKWSWRVARVAAICKGCPLTKLHWNKKIDKKISALCSEIIKADVVCCFSDF